MRPNQGGYQYLTSAMNILGEVLKAEGDLPGARKQFDESLAILNKVGMAQTVAETQGELADLAVYEGQPERVEPLLRSAITEFQQEKAIPDIVGAYVTLSRALLMQGKVEEARNAIQHAAELGQDGSDPALKASVSIQNARVEMASGKQSSLTEARTQLNAAIATAKRLGHYGLECEARLARGQLETKIDPRAARTQLTVLASESRSHGFELLARQAEQAVAVSATSIAADNRAVR
jgi:ATP/maltotriose-dependent transcriptional regulator MalT